jgi:hypothetical protein
MRVQLTVMCAITQAINHKYFTEACDFNPNCVWRKPPTTPGQFTAGLDIKYYPERPLQSIGMNGQLVARGGSNTVSSSQHHNANSHKRAATGSNFQQQQYGNNKNQRR